MKKMQDKKGFTLIELLIVVAIIGIIAAIAVPGLLRARMSGNEASAIGSVRAISSGQATYAASCGGGGYADTLVTLATAPTAGGAAFISPDLSTDGVEKSGYTFTVAPGDDAEVVLLSASTCSDAADSQSEYFVSAEPVTPGSTGGRAFASDERGTIYQGLTGAALADADFTTAGVLLQ